MILWIITILGGISSIISLILYIEGVVGMAPVLVAFGVLLGLLILVARSAVLRSPVLCTSTAMSINITDGTGQQCRLDKIQKFMPLSRHITRFQDTTVSQNPIEDLTATLDGLESTVRVLDQPPGSTVWAHEFQNALRPWRRHVRRVHYTYRDCFTQSREWYEVAVIYPGIKLEIDLFFPRSRIPTNITAYRMTGSVALEVKDLTPDGSEDPSTVVVRFHTWLVRVGTRYRIEWTW